MIQAPAHGADTRRSSGGGEQSVSELRFKVETNYGRMYVSGPDASLVTQDIPGRYRKSGSSRPRFEVSLTLETLQRLKEGAELSSRELASRCSDSVMRWARAARKSKNRMVEIHTKIDEGYRTPLPWFDIQGNGERPPFAHQEIMATVASEVSGCAFLAEMGTGKTRAAIEAMGHHARTGTIEMCLVVAPVAVTSVWMSEIGMWSDTLEPIRLDGPVRDRKEWLSSTARAVRSGNYRHDRMPVAIINYEVLHKMADTIMGMGIRLGLVFDEGHRIRNPHAKMSKAARRVSGSCPWRLLLTGTPILNGLHNLWNQWYVIDYGVDFGGNYVQFRREFFDENPWSHSMDAKSGVVEMFGARLRIRGLRYRKEDCLDLPPKVYSTRDIQMNQEQTRAYRQMENDLIVRIEEMEDQASEDDRTASAGIILTQILRLTQITSGFLPLDDEPEGTPPHRFKTNPKLDAMEEIVREQISLDRSVIIWAWYREDIKRISERLADQYPAMIVGGMSHPQREDAQRRFNNRITNVLIGNPASGGVGLNMQAASVAIYYSQGYNLEHRMQSEDRCHRSGSEMHDSVTYIDLCCGGTIDEVICEALAGKLELAEAVTEFRARLGEA